MNPKHLYLHIPFCKNICFYCDFCHRIYDKKIVQSWLLRIKEELDAIKNKDIETIYLGGGTPTCLDVEELRELLEYLKPFSENVKEYTIEINPETFSNEKAKVLKEYGINRASVGVQTFNESLLKKLNRKHTYQDVLNTFSLLRENNIVNISADLMYSLPSQTVDGFLDDIKELIKLGIPHISFYSLTIEENSVFGKTNIKPLDEDIEAEMYEKAQELLETNGYRHYEVSNYCLDGYQSLHNMTYWKYEDFYGVGCGASGKIGDKRYDHTRDINEYIKGNDNMVETVLTIKDLMFEHLMMSSRMDIGLDLIEFKRRYGQDALFIYEKQITALLKENKVKIDDNHLVFTNREILNNILVDFID